MTRWMLTYDNPKGGKSGYTAFEKSLNKHFPNQVKQLSPGTTSVFVSSWTDTKIMTIIGKMIHSKGGQATLANLDNGMVYFVDKQNNEHKNWRTVFYISGRGWISVRL